MADVRVLGVLLNDRGGGRQTIRDDAVVVGFNHELAARHGAQHAVGGGRDARVRIAAALHGRRTVLRIGASVGLLSRRITTGRVLAGRVTSRVLTRRILARILTRILTWVLGLNLRDGGHAGRTHQHRHAHGFHISIMTRFQRGGVHLQMPDNV